MLSGCEETLLGTLKKGSGGAERGAVMGFLEEWRVCVCERGLSLSGLMTWQAGAWEVVRSILLGGGAYVGGFKLISCLIVDSLCVL